MISVLLTCHNRREKTLACLDQLHRQQLPKDVNLHVTLVDDGSTDGTAEAIHEGFQNVEILRGDGNLFWCGGMRKAWQHAAQSDPDYYLLLNDDTILKTNAVALLLDICGTPSERRIAVAAIREPGTDQISYGGTVLSGDRPQLDGIPKPCDTFNANCVLVPRAVFQEMGMFHTAYTHAMGDTDYGLQARRLGIEVLQSGVFLGECPRNPTTGGWRDRSLPRNKRFKILQSPKGLPFREWMEFNRRNAGWKWPYYTVSPILRILLGK